MSPTAPDPYQVLGVPKDADAETIKAAYRRQAMRYHPDRNPGDKQAEERFKSLSEAYALLRDPQARERYDRYGAADPRGYRQPDPAGVDWGTIFREAEIPIDWGARGGIPSTGSAVFDALFGMVAGMMRRSGLLPGETREVALTVGLGDLVHGAAKRLRVPGPSVCAVCSGSGRVSQAAAVPAGTPGQAGGGQAASTQPAPAAYQTACASCGGSGLRRGDAFVDVSVPKRSEPSAKLRLRGLGGPGRPPGDLLVKLDLRLPEGARLAGRDVVAELPLPPAPFPLPASADFQGVEVKLPASLRNGQQLRVAGAGLAGGDLLLTVRFDLVRGLTRGAGEWLRKLWRGGGGR